MARRAARDCDVVVATYDELAGFGLEDLAGKTVVTSAISDDRLAELASRGVDMVLDATPQPFHVTVTAAVLEAMMLAIASSSGPLTNDDLLDMIVSAGLEPRVLYPNGPRRKSRFAFVIHPLSQEYFQRVEPLATIAKVAPAAVMDVVEKAMAYAPPFTYSHVTGIKSPTGAEAEGWLISVGGTPKELMAHSPEFTYGRLLAAAETARKLGAQVMGLGCLHQGRRRRWRDGRQAGSVADHDRQQLQRLRCSVGGARGDAAARDRRVRRPGTDQGQGHGRGSDRGHRVGLRQAAGAVQR